jgi:hypothetical protein
MFHRSPFRHTGVLGSTVVAAFLYSVSSGLAVEPRCNERADGPPWLVVVIAFDMSFPGAEQDRKQIETLFETAVDQYNKGRDAVNQVRYDKAPRLILVDERTGGGTPLDREQFLDRIRGLQLLSPEDTILVLVYKGHGAVDLDGHRLLSLSANGDRFQLPRDEVRNTLVKLRPRLTVLLTECCAVSQLESAGLAHYGDEELLGKDFGDLFVTPRGLVDITSSTYRRIAAAPPIPDHILDEASWSSVNGGFFLSSFFDLMRGGDPAIRRALGEQDGPRGTTPLVTWHRFSDALIKLTDSKYVDWRKTTLQAIDAIPGIRTERLPPLERNLLARQLHQTPQVFSLPEE